MPFRARAGALAQAQARGLGGFMGGVLLEQEDEVFHDVERFHELQVCLAEHLQRFIGKFLLGDLFEEVLIILFREILSLELRFKGSM